MFNELAVNHIPVFLIYINQTFPSCTSRAIKITQITRNSLNDRVRMYFYFHFTSVIKYSTYSKSTFVVLCRLRRVLSAESGIAILLANVIMPNTDLPHIIMIIIIIIFYMYLSLTYLVQKFLEG